MKQNELSRLLHPDSGESCGRAGIRRRRISFFIYAIFECLVLYSFYLYSLRSDIVFWGSSLNDGLYFLAYFFCVLPLIILVSALKNLFEKRMRLIRFSYYIYAIFISIPALISLRSQLMLNIGMLICLLVAVINFIEYLYFRKQPISKCH